MKKCGLLDLKNSLYMVDAQISYAVGKMIVSMNKL